MPLSLRHKHDRPTGTTNQGEHEMTNQIRLTDEQHQQMIARKAEGLREYQAVAAVLGIDENAPFCTHYEAAPGQRRDNGQTMVITFIDAEEEAATNETAPADDDDPNDDGLAQIPYNAEEAGRMVCVDVSDAARMAYTKTRHTFDFELTEITPEPYAGRTFGTYTLTIWPADATGTRRLQLTAGPWVVATGRQTQTDAGPHAALHGGEGAQPATHAAAASPIWAAVRWIYYDAQNNR